MVTVYVGAGLANRMFQYAFALSLKNKGYNVCIDECTFKPRYDFENIKLENVFSNIILRNSKDSYYSLILNNNRVSKLFKRITEYFPDYRYIERWNLSYYHNIEKKASFHCMYIGFWISYKYFNDIESLIKEAFVFREFTSLKNLNLASRLSQEESVAVHFRKNIDYIKNLPNTCPPNYYYNAIKYIKLHVDNPKFYFFSDNWEWVKENIKGVDYTAVNWNPSAGPDSYCDMQLMSLCKHNIIANSTYSWWGAYLNNNENKIIICPDLWFDNMQYNLDDIVPSKWIVIK